MKLSKIKPNPQNPRTISDEKFDKLVKSIKEFPQMMELRPIIIDENNVIQGGNMRFMALTHLGYKDVPDEWVKQGKDLTADQWREFVVKDNLSMGEWDIEDLEKEWYDLPLEDWGMDLPEIEPTKEKKTEQLSDFKRSHVLISYHPDRHLEVQELIEKLSEYSDIDIETASN